MRLFLFSASIFYILGLKLTSVIEIKPFFHQKSVLTETSVIPAEKHDPTSMDVKSAPIKKDTLIRTEPKSSQIPVPTGKNKEK